MKFIIETEDPLEINQLVNASNMAYFIFDLVYNGWREFKETDYVYEIAWDKINKLLEEHNININELVH